MVILSEAGNFARSQPRLLGIGLIIMTVFMFALLDALAKYLGQFYPVPGLVWARYAVHCLVMVALLGPKLGTALVRTRRPWLQILRGLLLLGSTFFFFAALQFLPLAEASAIGYVTPLLVTILSVPLLGERVGPRRWAAVLVGFIGVLIILRPGGGILSWAAALPICMSVCYSFYQIITRRISGDENPYATLFISALVGTLAMSFVLPFYFAVPTAWHAVLIGALGLLGGFGHFLLIKAFEHAPASVLQPFSYSHMVWTTILGWLVFGQLPDHWGLVGMAIIAASGLYVAYRESVRARAKRGFD